MPNEIYSSRTQLRSLQAANDIDKNVQKVDHIFYSQPFKDLIILYDFCNFLLF